MLSGPFLLALSAGMVASVNPCGFAMLPAYLGYFMGSEGAENSTRHPLMRGLTVSIALTAGFITVFGLFGLVWIRLAGSFQEKLPFATMVIGVALVILGIAMLRGFEPVLSLPTLQKGGDSQELASMYLFGVSYAVASLSCTIPAFIAASTVAVDQSGWLSGLAIFVVYGLGMGLVIGALTLTMAVARQGLLHRLRSMMKHVTKASAVLLILAGAYVTYFGYDEWRVLSGDLEERWILRQGSDLQISAQRWLNNTGPVTVALFCGTLVIAAILWSRLRRRSAA